MSEQSARHDPHPAPSAGDPARALLLVALAFLLLVRWRDGAMALYVHPGIVPFLVLTAFGLLALAGVRLWVLALSASTRGVGRPSPMSWGVAAVALVVVLGALAPARPLGAAAAASQAAELPPPALMPLTDETASWTLLEWAQAVNGGVRRERLAGRPASFIGFVYRPRQGGAAGEILVTRFVVRCCAADGLAVSLPVRHVDADALAADTWVQIEGVIRFAEGGSTPGVFVEADRLTVVPAPATPYLTPS